MLSFQLESLEEEKTWHETSGRNSKSLVETMQRECTLLRQEKKSMEDILVCLVVCFLVVRCPVNVLNRDKDRNCVFLAAPCHSLVYVHVGLLRSLCRTPLARRGRLQVKRTLLRELMR